MKDEEQSLRVKFLDLTVESRSRAVTLFADIKAELRKGYALRDLGLGIATSDDLCLSFFLNAS